MKHVTCDGVTSKLEMLDTAGQELFVEQNFENWVAKAHCFILVYDITNLASFQELDKIHELLLKTKNCSNTTYPIIVVGNRKDLYADRKVTTEKGENKSKEWECNFLETSAKTRENVENMIFTCIREVRKKKLDPAWPEIGVTNKKSCCTLL